MFKRKHYAKHTPESLERAAHDYFKWVDENPIIEQKPMISSGEPILFPVPKARPYTLAGYCLFSGIGRTYFHELSHKPDFKDVCEWIKEACYAQKFDGAAVGIFNHFIIARDLGLTDKKEVQAVVNQTQNRTLEDFYAECQKIDDGKMTDSDLIDKALDATY